MMCERCEVEIRIENQDFRYRLFEMANTVVFLAAVQVDILNSVFGAEHYFWSSSVGMLQCTGTFAHLCLV